jgi:hypothetical protein
MAHWSLTGLQWQSCHVTWTGCPAEPLEVPALARNG